MIRVAFFLPCLLVLLASCQSSSYQEELSFNNTCWDAEASLVLKTEVKEAGTQAIRIGLEFDQEYPYQNIYLQLKAIASDGAETKTLVHEAMIKPDGEWLAPISRGKISWEIQSDFTFPEAGEYEIQLRQYLREESLCGIHKVGISLD